jgi:hypothetical protein
MPPAADRVGKQGRSPIPSFLQDPFSIDGFTMVLTYESGLLHEYPIGYLPIRRS